MENKFLKNKFLVLLALLLVSSCSGANNIRNIIGANRSSPDEFMVQPREKLVIPAHLLTLPEPTQKQASYLVASTGAEEALFGKIAAVDRGNTALEDALLASTGADKVNANIRQQVEAERADVTGVFGTERGGTMEAILDPFGYNAPVDPVLDGRKETKRIKEALAKGEDIDSKKVESIEPNKEKWK